MNNKAFTLLEILIVIIIITIIYFITSFNYLHSNYKTVLKQEANYLGSSLESMQISSLGENKESYIQISNDGFYCYLDNNLVSYHIYQIPLKIKTNFPNNKINITKNGRVSKGGTIYFLKGEEEVKLTIQISMGRYTIE